MSEHRTTGCTRLLSLIGLALAPIAAIGCGTPADKAVIAEPVAPVRPPEVKAETLPPVKFVDITTAAGIRFVHANGAFGDKLLPETMGAGVAFLDYDNDGDQDLLFVNSCPWPGHEAKTAPTQALYRNDGKGHFDDVTKQAGLDRTFYGQGVAVGDYDNDGDPDLYITAIGGGHLFRNDGKGHFDDATEAAHARGPNGWLTGAAFIDIDNDGDQGCRRQLFPSKSYLSSVELPLTFGLGKAEKADEATITWPSGKVTTLKDLKANQVLNVAEE